MVKWLEVGEILESYFRIFFILDKVKWQEKICIRDYLDYLELTYSNFLQITFSVLGMRILSATYNF